MKVFYNQITVEKGRIMRQTMLSKSCQKRIRKALSRQGMCKGMKFSKIMGLIEEIVVSSDGGIQVRFTTGVVIKG